MTSAANDARTVLDAWRTRGDDRMDPVRFRFMDAIERRASRYEGQARRILDERLSLLLGAYARDLEHAVAGHAQEGRAEPPRVPVRGPLGELVDYVGNLEPAGVAPIGAGGEAGGTSRLATTRTRVPELGLTPLDYLREVWSRLSVDVHLRQSLDQVPEHAGPLNSESLVYRSLALMRELSPGYLQQFLSYVDALAWLEALGDDGTLAPKEPPRAATAKKTARGKAR